MKTYYCFSILLIAAGVNSTTSYADGQHQGGIQAHRSNAKDTPPIETSFDIVHV